MIFSRRHRWSSVASSLFFPLFLTQCHRQLTVILTQILQKLANSEASGSHRDPTLPSNFFFVGVLLSRRWTSAVSFFFRWLPRVSVTPPWVATKYNKCAYFKMASPRTLTVVEERHLMRVSEARIHDPHVTSFSLFSEYAHCAYLRSRFDGKKIRAQPK